jgi:cell division protein FtsN
MGTTGARNRGKSGPGRSAWVALGGGVLVILGLTFVLGLLVGRQWARQTPPTVAAEPARKAVPTRRSGLAEVSADRGAPPQEKLTFYQTLTAPLGPVPVSGRTEVTAKTSPAVSAPRANTQAAPERAKERVPSRGDEPALPSRTPAGTANREGPPLNSVDAKAAAEGHEANPAWTVQVGVFKSAEQAERIRGELAGRGFQAEVTPMTVDDGQFRYRVRVGVFKTKDEAIRTAERVRSDRSLPTFVTAR